MRSERFRYSFFLAVAGLLLAAASIPGYTQITASNATDTGLGGSNTITGMVLSPTGQRLVRRIAVRLQTPSRGDRMTTTDEYGNFSFRGLVSGDYVVLIEKEQDFEPVSQMVSVVQVRGFPGQGYMVNIRLKNKKGAEAKPAVISAELADVPKTASELYYKALETAKTGDRLAAIEMLRNAVTEYPKFMLAFNEIGVQYLRLSDFDKADEALQSALKIEPEAFAPTMNRGIVLFSSKKFAEAEPLLRKAVAAKPEAPVTHYFLGQTLANLGKFPEAEKELGTALSTGGEEMKEAHRVMAILLSVRGDKVGAAKELETYLKLTPNAPDAEKINAAIRQMRGEAPPTKPNE